MPKPDSSASRHVDRCKSLLKSLNQKLQDSQEWQSLEQQLEPLQQARMHLAIATSASAVYKTLLHLRGPCLEEQAHARELARLETYKRKVAKVESEKWLQEHRPILSVDVAGANRFISAAIPELTQKQKEALRVAGKKHGGHAAQDDPSAVSATAASHFLDSLVGPSAPGHVPLNRGGKKKASPGGATAKEPMRTKDGTSLSRKEKRKVIKGLQGRSWDEKPKKQKVG